MTPRRLRLRAPVAEWISAGLIDLVELAVVQGDLAGPTQDEVDDRLPSAEERTASRYGWA